MAMPPPVPPHLPGPAALPPAVPFPPADYPYPGYPAPGLPPHGQLFPAAAGAAAAAPPALVPGDAALAGAHALAAAAGAPAPGAAAAAEKKKALPAWMQAEILRAQQAAREKEMQVWGPLSPKRRVAETQSARTARERG